MTLSAPPPALPRPAGENPSVTRILHQARAHFFVHGYSAFTMDDLATELGMSKKTLYVHFSGKDEIIGAVIEELGREIRANADALLADRHLNFTEKLRAFADAMVRRLTQVHPRMMRDLQRFAPDLYLRITEMREKNIPYVFGRFIAEGQQAGMVRANADTAFAVQFFLQAMNGLIQPPVLEQLGLAPGEVVPRAIELFFGGLLTPAGRKAHEKLSVR